jgi:tetratricopeptide (TPR) repeat protein
MKTVEALRRYPVTKIFKVIGRGDIRIRDAEKLADEILPANEGFFLIQGKNILQDGTIKNCYIDMSMPERISDYAYFLQGESLEYRYHHECDGEIISAVPIDACGNYELFYSRIAPEAGIEVLRRGLRTSGRKRHIAQDLGYILRDEGRFQEAIAAFLVASEEAPSQFLYLEISQAYAALRDYDTAARFKRMAEDAPLAPRWERTGTPE